MCGIVGFVGRDRGAAESEAALARMCGAIRHRGPNDEGHHVEPGVALGMRRLSIIDVARGRQPIANEDGSVHVVFNGEIYNHASLQRSLEAAGHRFATRSDTETLVHLYEERGDAMVRELRGMFAFAIWDARRGRLLVARDRVGIKPLYYWEDAGGVGFASELRALLALEGTPRPLNRGAIARFLTFGYVPEPDSVFEGVHKLPPGHLLTWEREGGLQIDRYWSAVRPETAGLSEEDAVTELRARLSDAVGSHLESEVPLGAFLSGGIDSTVVVAEMARQLDRQVQTFSIGFAEDEYNEAPHAAAVARAIGTDHTELIVRPDADVLVEEVVRAFDEPFADSSALPTFLVSSLARQSVTVVLSGDGGDELFGGYTRYADTLGRRELQPAPLRSLVGAVAARLPHAVRGRNRLLDISRARRGRYASTVALGLADAEAGCGRPEMQAHVGPLAGVLDSWFDEASERDFASQLMLVDMMTYLPGDILTKVDRVTMAASIEARVPLLDHPLVEFAVGLPSSMKLRDGVGKWILRRAIEDLVPASVLDRPKQGFALPIARWFRSDLRHRVDAILRPQSAIYEFVDPRAVRRLVTEHLVSRRDHSTLLWRLLVLEMWLELLAAGALATPSSIGTSALRILGEARTPRTRKAERQTFVS